LVKTKLNVGALSCGWTGNYRFYVITALLNDIQIIDCTHATAMNAAHSTMEDLEDALQYFAALSHGINYFISGDKKLKKNALPALPVNTARELVNLVS